MHTLGAGAYAVVLHSSPIKQALTRSAVSSFVAVLLDPILAATIHGTKRDRAN